ncbi:MAG: tetratricopeptide repeat protein [Chlorobiales bacterium]|nr:tetratricopeptide repeat protein [Chlorobiales bacterium]
MSETTQIYRLFLLRTIMQSDDETSSGKEGAIGKKVLNDDSKDHIAWYKKVFYYFSRGKLELAIETWEQAVQISPDFADGYHELGVAYGAIGRYDKAVEHFEKAISIISDHTLAHYNLGVVFGATGKKELAARQAKELRRYDIILAEMLSKQLKKRYKQTLQDAPVVTSKNARLKKRPGLGNKLLSA